MARALNGSGDKMTVTNVADIQGAAGDFTIAGWLNVASYSSYATVFAKASGAARDWAMFFADQSNLYAVVNDTPSTPTVTTLPSTNTWWHFCWKRSGSGHTLYANGTSYGTWTDGGTRSGTEDLVFGKDPVGGGTDMAGRYAEWGIWKGTALGADDVASLAKGFAPPLVRLSALTAYWPFIGRTSPEIELHGGYTAALTGTAQYDHPRIIYPHSRKGRRFTTAAGGGGVFQLQHIYRHVAGIGA